MKHLSALLPLCVLFSTITLACVLGYSILLIFGDIYSLNKLISRLSQLLLVLSIFPLRHYLKLSWTELGFADKPLFIRQIMTGFIAGLATLLPVFLLLYALGVNVFDDTKIWTVAKILSKTGIALLLALLISVVEEPLFRGLLLTSLQKKLNLATAIIVSAVYYGSLHFLETSTEIPYPQITFSSGFSLFAEAIANWLNPAMLSAFIALVMVGLFLGVVRTQIAQSLGLCIGLHASWVWQIKLTKMFFNPNYFSDYFFLVSVYDGLVGPLIAGWLFLVLLGYALKKAFLAHRHR
jgi:hypothetical protein